LENQEIKVCESIRNGDKHAFESVFKTYYKILCSYANQIIADSDNSEEIVQEMFFQLWQKKEFLFIETSLKSYLFRAVHNSCLNFIKHNKIKLAYSSSYLHQNETSGSQYLLDESEELRVLIGKAVEKLPPERKKVFMMIRYEERKYQEVADILGISVKTVENQMGKAMQFLREALKGYIPVFIMLIFVVLQIIFKFK
jgi:RNA polymerase sigma-70 factor (ECF subfamily)